MSWHASKQSPLTPRYESMLSDGVQPYLKRRGFTKSGSLFRRRRGSLSDLIGFQANWHNDVTPWHAFFVNVGVGLSAVNAPSNDRARSSVAIPPSAAFSSASAGRAAFFGMGRRDIAVGA